MRTPLLTLLAAVSLAVALQSAPAPAADPRPEPCDGKFEIKDAAGDQGFKEQGATVVPMPSSTDVVGVFHRVDGDKVTANIVIDDMSTTPPAGFTGVRYRSYLTVNGTIRYVQALVSSGGVAYTYGSDFAGVSYTEDGATSGAIFPGKNGVVQIVIPADAGGKVGTKLSATSASVGAISLPVPPEVQLPPFYLQADTAPDGAADGPTVTPAPCAATSTPAGTGSAAVTLKLKSGKQSAKKANAKHSATVALKSSAALTDVVAKLKRGTTTIGTGKVAKLSGTTKVAIKLKGKVKKGAYKLVVAAKRADGSKFKATLKLTFGA